jgi:uncharacterized protein (TIGR00255 family)
MIKSMTAFAKKQIQHDGGIVSWEVRSLNSRYLDVYFHLPETFREIEINCREVAKKYLQRGRVDCTLHYQVGDVASEDIALNKIWLNKLYVMSEQVKETFGKDVTVDFIDLLRWPGIMQTVQEDMSKSYEVVLELFERVLTTLDEQKVSEGNKLSQFIEQRLVAVRQKVEEVQMHLPSILDLQRDRVLNRFEELDLELDKTRLEQEMVFIVQRMDVSEELDRLNVHIAEVQRLLNIEEVVGRRLDFLMQELNREANTLGSKSVSEITSHASVEMKVLIEQMREQVQNIE